MDFVSNRVLSRRFFTALASSAAILVTACGGTTSASSPDAGGARPEDGASTDGEADGGHLVPCNGGPVMFHMRATEGSNASYCVGGGCRWYWLDVTTEHGETVVYSLDRERGGLPVCLTPRPLKAEGEHETWDGRVWAPSTCGNQLPCWAPTCATPAKYIATMCVNANTITDAGLCSFPTSLQTCIEVEFEYPTAAIVEGVLP
jgi:hypothetical protein